MIRSYRSIKYSHEKVSHVVKLFVYKIDTATKNNIVQDFQCAKKENFPRYNVLTDKIPISNVASFVTKRVLDIFGVLTLNAKGRAKLILYKDLNT